ncbi:hypothetical protein [Streptomyces sp. NPDC017529]|uniref:hypothetical protein n=1 Tax=Streptomyces sp. NPDC017529 TaxID=3365000 RepID=UPI0037930E13
MGSSSSPVRCAWPQGDTQLRYPDLTGLEYDKVRSALLDSPAQVKLVILDC